MKGTSMHTDLSELSTNILNAAFEIDLLKQGKGDIATERKDLKSLVEELSSLGLNNEVVFKARIFSSLVFWEFLKERDGKNIWEKPENAQIDKVFLGIRDEFLNLQRLAQYEQGDPAQALKFCLWLHQRALNERHRQQRPRGLAA